MGTRSHPLSAVRCQLAALIGLAVLSGCQTSEAAFLGDRLLTLCTATYYTCGVTAGCELDTEHYVRGSFPGARRVIVHTEEDDTALLVGLYLTTEVAPGTELLTQVYEPDCTLDPQYSQEHWEDVDIFAEAGNDHSLLMELEASSKGEHLLELYSDATAGYLLIVEELE